MQHIDFVKKMLDSMAFIDTIERMNKQQIENKIDEGQELTPDELRSLFASALAETAPLLPERHKLADWIAALRRALGGFDFFEPLRMAALGRHASKLLALLAAFFELAASFLAMVVATPPPALPAAMAGINLAPRLLPIPRAALAG